MTSTDREILIAIQVEQTEQGKRIARIESRLDSHDVRLTRMESLQVETVNRLDVLEARFDMLLWCIGIAIAILAVMMGICTWLITALTLRPREREQIPSPVPVMNDTAPALIYAREESRKE